MSERGENQGSSQNGMKGSGNNGEAKDPMEGIIRIILVGIVTLAASLAALGWFTNSAPVAMDDNIYVTKGELVNKLKDGSSSLLANDYDADKDNELIVFAVIEQPTEGKLLFEPNGAFTYRHLEGEPVTDRFVYKICDQAWPFEKCSKATVYIEIDPEAFPFKDKPEE